LSCPEFPSHDFSDVPSAGLSREEISRRAVLGAIGVAAARPTIGALPQGNVIDFDGSVRNSGPANRRAFEESVHRLHRLGGGILRIAPGRYRFDGEAVLKAANVRIAASGATFEGHRCRLTIASGSHKVEIVGLTLIETSGSPGTFLLNIGGSGCRLRDMHFEKRPSAGGYIGYCQQYTAGNLFENVSFAGSNGIFVGGRDHRITGGWAESSGGDDCWAIKASTHPCRNIRISGFHARGFAALVSIGSEVGSNPSVKAIGPLSVREVTVENCVAERCTYLAYIKPGGIEGGAAYDYRHGLVEDVALTDCRCEDPAGEKFRDAVYVSPGRGATVRGLAIRNLSVFARGASPAVQTVGALYLRVLAMGPDDPGSAIENVTVDGLRCIDPHGGVATGPSAPGLPIQTVVAIEKLNRTIGQIGAVTIVGVEASGCSRSAVQVGPGVAGPIAVSDSSFAGFAAAPLASADRNPVIAMSPVTLRNVVVTPSPHAPIGTKGLSAGEQEMRL